MKLIKDIFGREIEITDERWDHVCTEHPEIINLQVQVRDTLTEPEVIKISMSDKSVRLYYRYFDDVYNGKYVLAVVKTNKRNFLLTAYVTDYIKAGEELWKRKN